MTRTNPRTILRRIYSSTRLLLAATSALLLAQQACAPPQAADQSPSVQAAEELLRDPRTAAAVQRGSEHLMGLRTHLGLTAHDTFRARSSVNDQLGLVHTRFEQIYRGVRVWAAEAIVQLSPQTRSQSVLADLRPGINISTIPSLTPSQALKVAHDDLQPRGPYDEPPTAELLVYPEIVERVRADRLRGLDGELNALDIEQGVERYTLAYYVHTELENGPQEIKHTDYLINAHNGAVLKKWDSLQTSAVVGTGKSQYSGMVMLDTDSTATGFQLKDVKRGMPFTTNDMNHATTGNGTLYTDILPPDNTWGDGMNYLPGGPTTNNNGQTSAVDAHYGTGQTYDYYKEVHGRNGIDGAGKATFIRVHFSNRYDNAFWQDTCFCMTYGDGQTFKVLTSIDVAGHEMTHGVTSTTSKLIYSGESGGLNESMSDIHGSMVEFYARGGSGMNIPDPKTPPEPGDGNFLIGEQIRAAPLRFMHKPSKDGASKDNWYAGIGGIDVHYSSGPLNRAFYFLSQGASNMPMSETYSMYLPGGMTGIGNNKAARIAFRALTLKMMPNTNYAGARTTFLDSTKDLYGDTGPEYKAVQNAFAAINVGLPAGGDTIPPTTAITAPTGGSTVMGTVNITANAMDNVAVTKVDFLAGTTVVGTDTTAPYSFGWDSTRVPNGNYVLTTKAYDATGNVGTSTAVNVVVNNGGMCSMKSQLFTNPGFESGPAGWTTSAGVIDNSRASNAHSGTWVGWLDGYGAPHKDTAYQQVAIPAAACTAQVSFWLAIMTDEIDPVVYDKLTVTVQDSAGQVLGTLGTFSNRDRGAYSQKTFDLAAYKGKTVRIHFEGVEDLGAATSFFIDDLALDITQ